MTESDSEPKYPDVPVQLDGEDGNCFDIIARCRKAALKNGVPAEEIAAFIAEAKSGDYDDLIQTCMKWFDVY